jgi:hypothetical protein
MAMSDGPEAGSRVSDIFMQVLHADPSHRAALIRELCGDDPYLTREITELVAAAERAPSTAGLIRQAVSSADELPALPPGTQIGGYAIERLIASGGMGMVYLARDIALNRPVAIKALRPSIARDPQHRSRLKHEAQLMAQLAGHPNIATVHALLDLDDTLYIVEECLPGPTVRELLRDGPLPVSDAIAVAIAVLRALDAAHRQRIVHRDLKPENVMRTSTGGWKVLDFGIAKLEAPDPGATLQLTRADQRLGTPLYMSPEQMTGEPVDGRSDLFAFGIMLYELLTRRHPFARGGDVSALSTWTAVLNEPPQPFEPHEVEHLPRGLPALILQCLEKDPGRRWSSAADAEAALHAIHNGELPAIAAAPVGKEVFWWQFHEATAAIVYWLTLIPAWHVRPWISPVLSQLGKSTVGFEARMLFLLLISTVAVLSVLRFSFVFVAGIKPAQIHDHLARAKPWVKVGDVLFAALLVGAGVAVSAEHQGWAVLLIALGLGSFAIAWFVEPLTERDALDALATATSAPWRHRAVVRGKD